MKTMPFIAYALPAIPILGHLAVQAFGTLRLRAAAEMINGVISSRSDLDRVRNAIQTNLLLGIPILCNAVLLTASLAWAGINSRVLMLLYIAVLAAGQVVMWRICRPVEKRFKALPIEGRDADLTTEYKHYVEQWSGFHLFLKLPKRADAQQTASSSG